MKSVLFCIPLKPGCLDQYLAFAKQSAEDPEAYSDMLRRYDILCAKIWHNNLGDQNYVYIYHEVDSEFEEKMKGWDTSEHPYDVWFRESIMAVYDIDSAATVTPPEHVLDFKA